MESNMSSSTNPSSDGTFYTPPEYLSRSGADRMPEWHLLSQELNALWRHTGQVMSTLAHSTDLHELVHARAGFDRIQLTLDTLRARGALRTSSNILLAERTCLLAAKTGNKPADIDELLSYFADFSGVRTPEQLLTHVLNASAVLDAFTAYAEAHSYTDDNDRVVMFEDRRPLPAPDAAYFIAELSEDRRRQVMERDEEAVDWDAAQCVARIVKFLESYACSAIPWSTLERSASSSSSSEGSREEQQKEMEQEDEARERFAVGLRIFTYLRAQAVVEATDETPLEKNIAGWQAHIPEEAFQNHGSEEEKQQAEEIAVLNSRRQGMDVTGERQQILLGALMHAHDTASSEQQDTNEDVRRKLKGMCLCDEE